MDKYREKQLWYKTQDSSLTVKLRFGHSLQVHTSSASPLQNADRRQRQTQTGSQIDRQTDKETDIQTESK